MIESEVTQLNATLGRLDPERFPAEATQAEEINARIGQLEKDKSEVEAQLEALSQ